MLHAPLQMGKQHIAPSAPLLSKPDRVLRIEKVDYFC
jgi:hypothetical protein